ncbi:unnamed protein product [Rhodiola kirilowii]
MGASPSVPEKSIHDFTVKDSKGNDVDLGIYKGKVLLVVNVASRCGLTDANYTQLTKLYSNYKTKAPNKPALEELGASREISICLLEEKNDYIGHASKIRL